MTYTTGPYNKCNEEEQWIRITDGCPNKCPYCYSPEKLEYYGIPDITRNTVKIMDMNLLSQPQAKDIIKDLGSRRVNNKVVHYELICGIDHRFLTDEIAMLLKENRFFNIRFAWDYGMNDQMRIKDCIKKLDRAGFKRKRLTCFIISDWKRSYEECLRKLDMLKVWNIKVSDCWYDNITPPHYQLNNWSMEQCLDFRKRCCRHNIMVGYDIDLTWKNKNINIVDKAKQSKLL